MSGFSGGSFSFSRSGRGGFFGHSRSSGYRRGGLLGGLHSHSHSSGHRGRYARGGHYRQVRRSGGCLGAFLVAAGLAGAGVLGLVTLIA